MSTDVELYVGYEHDGKGYKHQFRMKDGTTKTLYVTDEALLNFYSRSGMEDFKGCVGQEGEKGILGVPLNKERGEVLDKAKAIINGARQDQYGNPESSFTIISEFWTVYMTNKQKRPDALLGFIGRKDVALMMALMKIAREMNGAGKEDNLIDAAGYIGLAADMSNYKKENNND